MSITIYVTSDNHKPVTEEVTCHSCQEYGHDSECYYCKGEGFYVQPLCPDINMSNSNALTILGMVLGATPDYCGEISDIPGAIHGCMKVINSEKTIKNNVRPIEQGINFYAMGMDEDYIKSRLTKILEILKYAQTHNEKVVWG